MSLEQLYLALLIGGFVLLASIVGTRVATRVGFPSLLLFLLVGVLLGEDAIGVQFDDVELARNIGTAALAVILVEGGLTTQFADVRKVLAPAAALATIGVVISMAITAAGAHVLLGIDWQLALLLGAIVSSTDAAAVFSVLRVLPLPRRLAGLLEAESGFNDAPAVILVLMFSAMPFAFEPESAVTDLVYELLAGAAIGLACGFLGAIALRRIALPASGLYPIATFGLGIVAFAAAGAAHASGFIAAYLAAVVLANSGLPHRSATRSFAEGLGWLAQIGLFVLLGLLVDPSELAGEVVPAIVVGLVLLLIARPLSVVGSLAGFSVPWREQLFLSWAGLRGAVPIVLATFPIVAGVPDSHRLLNIVFILVVVFTLVQGPSLRPIAHGTRTDSAGLAARDTGRIGATRRPRSRTADDDGAAVVATAQRHRARTPAARPERDHADHPRRPHVRPAARHQDRGGRRTVDRHHDEDAGRRRGQAPRGQPARQAGLLVRRVRQSRTDVRPTRRRPRGTCSG